MMVSRTRRGFAHLTMAGAAAAALALAGCGGPKPAAEAPGAKVLHFGNSSEPLTLDPHGASGTWENNIIGGMFMGLTTEDINAKPIPGMAESWTTSADGLVWTFKLRDAVWSDGVAVTAQDFEYAFRRILDPKTAAKYAAILYDIKNAQQVNAGELPLDKLGVRAIDPKTFEITLANPAPYLPTMLMHYTSYPVPKHVVKKFGDDWIKPENIQVNGSYKLVEWQTNNFVKVRRNERFFDAANVCIDEIFYYPTTDVNTAERRVRKGELDINTDMPGQKVEFLKKELPGYVRIAPYMGTWYAIANTTDPRFKDERVRTALNMAIDRDFITKEVLRAGQAPTFSFVPPNMANYPGGATPGWASAPVTSRRVEARRLLEAAGFGPDNPLTFTFAHRNTGDNPRIAPAIQNDWQSIAPWVKVSLAPTDTQIHYDNLAQNNFQVADAAWIADYDDPINFLMLLDSKSGQLNYGRYVNLTYDGLLAQAKQEVDLARRADLLLQAEKKLLADSAVFPVYSYVSKNLVNPRVTGWNDNIVDIHRPRYMCVK